MSRDEARAAAPAILVIAEPGDAGALRAAALLRRRGASVLPLAPERLALARWAHDPMVGTEIVLADGAALTDDGIGAVLNRIRVADPPQFFRSEERDRLYAQAEFHALLLSWLAGLGDRVVNRPDPGSLIGARATPLEDRLRFAQEGRGAPASAATSARRLAREDGAAVAFAPGPEPSALDGGAFDPAPEAALAGGPAARLPRDAEPVSAIVVGDAAFASDGGAAPPDLADLARDAARRRGLTLAMLRAARFGGRLGGATLEPDPPLDPPPVVAAVADLLLLRAREGAE